MIYPDAVFLNKRWGMNNMGVFTDLDGMDHID